MRRVHPRCSARGSFYHADDIGGVAAPPGTGGHLAMDASWLGEVVLHNVSFARGAAPLGAGLFVARAPRTGAHDALVLQGVALGASNTPHRLAWNGSADGWLKASGLRGRGHVWGVGKEMALPLAGLV